jgi:Xaa-Pro aminopeptidase
VSAFVERVGRVRAAMDRRGVDTLLLSVGADLPWLTGYEAMALERLTMLVLPREGEATLVVPRLEAPRVVERPEVFTLRPWGETEDPVEIVAETAGAPGVVALGDRTWARFVLDLQARLPAAAFRPAQAVLGPLRAVKDAAEVTALRRAGATVDRVVAAIQAGEVTLVGRTEAEVAAEVHARLLAAGHHRVNFVIVASGPNGASPHHEPGDRRIEAGEGVLFDIGGTVLDGDGVGYCSDITRCVHLGPPPPGFRDLYTVLQGAQAQAVAAATVGTPCEDVDGVARRLITEGGYGDEFVHRTGHGIGIEAHEDPYVVAGNCEALLPGHAFSVEPGIYVEGRWGARIEDIVVATPDGPEALNRVPHDLIEL